MTSRMISHIVSRVQIKERSRSALRAPVSLASLSTELAVPSGNEFIRFFILCTGHAILLTQDLLIAHYNRSAMRSGR